MAKPEPIRRGELKGAGSKATHLDFEGLKAQLDANKGKKVSPFDNFFNSLKPENKANENS